MQIVCNGENLSAEPGITVARLLADLALASRPVAVEVNARLVPREHHAEQILHEGDRVEIVSLVGGG